MSTKNSKGDRFAHWALGVLDGWKQHNLGPYPRPRTTLSDVLGEIYDAAMDGRITDEMAEELTEKIEEFTGPQ